MTSPGAAGTRGTDGVLPAVAMGGAAGAALGSCLTSALSAWLVTAGVAGTSGAVRPVAQALLPSLPLFVVNVLGSFLLGALWARSRRHGPQWRPRLVAALGTGFLGSFTTMSSAVALVVSPIWWAVSTGQAVPAGIGGASGAAAALLGPVLAVLVVLAALSTAAAVAGLRLGGAPSPDHGTADAA